MVFSGSFTFFINIWLLKGPKMLLFNQNNNSEQTVLNSGRGKSYILLRFMEKYAVQDRKWLLFTCWFSLRILEDSKTRNFFFTYKTKRLNIHSFEKWVCPVFKFAYFNRDT